MLRPRTTARGLILLLLLGVSVGTAQAAVPTPLAFPVVGKVSYGNDFGAPRWQGSHQGNDIMARWRAPAVAAERGRVEFHTGSGRGTCMIYLRGRSGTTYVYIHLNNDLTSRSEDRGGCRRGVAYAADLRSGQYVRKGQLVGYVGDSGDAEGIHHHLHFEIRPSDRAINPFRHLNAARRLLFPRPSTLAPLSLRLRGRVTGVAPGSITVRVWRVYVSSVRARTFVSRNVTLAVGADAQVTRSTGGSRIATALSAARIGQPVTVRTLPFSPTWGAQLARPGRLAAGSIFLSD